MKNSINYVPDTELVSQYQATLDANILDILLQKHQNLIITVSKKHCQKHKRLDFEDVLQNAKLASIEAIKSFDFSKENKLSTYLYFKVAKSLLTCDDEQNFISCPSHMREVRSYIAGKYDFDKTKKQNFERKYNINTQQDFEFIKKSNQLLSDRAICTVPDDILPEQLSGNELNFIEGVNNSVFIQSLSKDEQEIVLLLMEGFSQNKISEIVKNTNSKQIHTKVNSIRKKFVKHYYG